MRLAIPYDKGQIFQSFGRTKRFMIYDIENGELTVKTLINTNGKGRGDMAEVLNKIQVDTLICGRLGEGAKHALTNLGIKFYAGVQGEANQAADDFLHNKLVFDNSITCENQKQHSASSA